MKLRRLRVEQFKRFRAPFELRDLTEGINLIAAPNESGKSTLVEALRAAFFERHRSSSVEYLRPWGDSAATPTVELDFELNGQPAHLLKRFLGRRACELRIGGQTLDGQAAEDHLAALLGFRFAGKGASSDEHWGIPGLLWVQQARSHELAGAVGHARDHLRQALGHAFGELAATRGDALLQTLQAQRNELLTPSGGAPRGAYEKALKLHGELQQRLAEHQAAIDRYRSDVDRLATLRREQARDDQQQPVRHTREQLAAAQRALDQARGLAERLQQAQQQAQQWQQQQLNLSAQLGAMLTEAAALPQREARLLAAREAAASADAREREQDTRLALAREAEAQARAALARGRDQAEQARRQQLAAELSVRCEAAALALARAQEAQDRLVPLLAQVQALALPQGTLAELRKAQAALSRLEAQLEAVATTLELDLLPGVTVSVQGQQAQGQSRRTLLQHTQIDIPGVGRLSIGPGGTDMDHLRQKVETSRSALLDRLRPLGASTLAELETRAQQHTQREAEAQAGHQLLQGLAPRGVAALEQELAGLRQQWTMLGGGAAAVEPAGISPEDLAAAEQRELQARNAVETASQRLNDARVAAARERAQAKAAEDELASLARLLQDPARAARQAASAQALAEAQAQHARAQQASQQLQQQSAGLNLQLLQQNVERLGASAQALEQEQQRRARDIAALEAALEAQGASGLEEQAAELQRDAQTAQRRCRELAQRAQALDHLVQLLRDKRAALAQRLRAPLQKHLNHALGILFPGAHIEVDEQLAPGRLTRQLAGREETGSFEEMSVGAREQLGIVARLAYADLLREAGRPTLLVLDDALVHSDEERVGCMQQVLYDAGQRHQLLIFTCHPAAWRDLGVPVRRIET
ncbi:MAG: AAA family ATPase [Rubrivivax sp.]|nr:AAA family ATPase [Rubrivivax sp.]